MMSQTVTWLSHGFTVYAHGTSWNDDAGVYIFAGLNSQNQWVALYVGQADNFRNRIPQHEQWTRAVRLGATHVHAMVVPLAGNRDKLEEELIQAFQPQLNTQLL
jgi:excinuclease UvrABC nuclease subunit